MTENVEDFIESFGRRINEFCKLSYQFGEKQNEQIKERNILQEQFRKVWGFTHEEKSAQVTIPATQVKVPFRYQYGVMKFSKEQYLNYKKHFASYDDFVFGPFLGKYFEEQTTLNSLLYHLLEYQEDLTVSQLFFLLRSILKTLKAPPVPLFPYTVGIIKEFVHFLGYLLSEKLKEGDSGDMRRSQMMVKILELILKHRSHIEVLLPLFQPTPNDLLEEDYLEKLHEHLKNKTLNEDEVLFLLQQLPIHELKKNRVKAHEMNKYIIEPMKRLFLVGQSSVKLILHFFRTLTALAHQYPESSLQIMTVLTRGCHWPGRFLSSLFLGDFPFSKMSQDSFPYFLREMYNLHSSKVDLKSDTHQQQFLDGYLLPWTPLISEVYSKYPDIEKQNEKMQFPFLRVLSSICINDRSPNSQFFDEMMELLLSLAFRSGTKERNHLKLLMNLRKEVLVQIIRIFERKREIKFSGFMKSLIESYVPFLLQTQPNTLNQLHRILVSKLPMGRWMLDESRDLPVLLTLIKYQDGRLSPFIHQFIQRINWSEQSSRVCFKFLLHGLQCCPSLFTLGGLGGKFRIPFESSEMVSSFMKEVEFKQDSHGVFHSLKVYLSLSLCEHQYFSGGVKKRKTSELAQNIKEQMILIRENISHGNIVGIFTSEILKMYIKLASHLDSDLEFTPAVTAFLKSSCHDRPTDAIMKSLNEVKFTETLGTSSVNVKKKKASELGKNEDAGSLLKIEEEEEEEEEDGEEIDEYKRRERYEKYVHLWGFCLISANTMGTMKLFDSLIREEYRMKRKLTPFIDSIKLIGATNTQKLIEELILKKDLPWVAYAYTLAHPLQIPPLEGGQGGAKSGGTFYEESYVNDDAQLDTSIECSMWIASDSGQKLLDSNRFFLSLLFWEHFFRCYFRMAKQHTARAFPMYLRQRMNKTFSKVAETATNEDIGTLFGSFCLWNPNAIPGGESFVDEFRKYFFPEGEEDETTRRKTGTLIPISEEEEEEDFNIIKYMGKYPSGKKEQDDDDDDMKDKPFGKEIIRYHTMRNKIEQTMTSASVLDVVSSDQEKLFSEEIISLCQLFNETREQYNHLKIFHLRATKRLFTTSAGKSQTKIMAPDGNTVLTEFPTQKTMMNSEEFDKNLKTLGTAHHQLLDVLEKLAFFFATIRKTTKDLSIYPRFESTAVGFFFTVLPPFLDLEFVRGLGTFYGELVEFVSEIGSRFISQSPKLQKKLLETVFAVLLKESKERYLETESKDRLVQERRVVRLRLLSSSFRPESIFRSITDEDDERGGKKMQKKEGRLLPLWEEQQEQEQQEEEEEEGEGEGEEGVGENISGSMKVVTYLDCFGKYISLMKYIIQQSSKISTLHEDEINALLTQFTFDEVFTRIATQRPAGHRFVKTEEIKLLVTTVQKSLMNPMLVNKLGNRLLRRCVEVAFPLEMGSFLKLALSLSKSGKYLHRWDGIFCLSPALMSEVGADLASQWLETMSSYMPINNSENAVSVVYLMRALVKQTMLQTLIQRSNCKSAPVKNLLEIIRLFLQNSEYVTIKEFEEVLNIYRDIITHFPFLIDSTWDFYHNVFHQFIQKKQKSGDTLPLRQKCSNMLQAVKTWKDATFHESKTITVLDEMYDVLPYDPRAIAIMFVKLNWDFLKKSNNSNVLTRFLRLYFDVRMYDRTIVPPSMDQWVGEDEYQVEDPMFSRLLGHQFAQLFNENGQTLCRMILSTTCLHDPTQVLLENAGWLTQTALKMDGEDGERFGEAIGRELYTLLFFSMKEASSSSSQKKKKMKKKDLSTAWFLSEAHNVDLLLKYLIPLAQKYYYSPTLIMAVFLSCERVLHTVPIHVKGRIPFGRVGAVPLIQEKDTKKRIGRKFHGLVSQFCNSLNNEELCKTIFATLPPIEERNLSLVHKVEFLEKTLISFMKLQRIAANENEQGPESSHLALPNGPLALPSPDEGQGEYEKLAHSCVEHHCPLLLTMMMIRKMSLSREKRNETILRNTMVWCMDIGLRYAPIARNFFDYLYLILYMIEIVENEVFDPIHVNVMNELVKKLQKVLVYCSESVEGGRGDQRMGRPGQKFGDVEQARLS